jgi:chromosome segregation ATPase
MEIDARNIKRALETTEEAAGLDPEEITAKIAEKRERLESLNDEVEEARQEVEDTQAALAEEEVRDMDGGSADVQAARQRLKNAQETLNEKQAMLEARADALQRSIEDLKQKRKAAEVRQAALKAKDLNEKALAKMRTLYQKVKALEALNAEVSELMQEAEAVTLDCNYSDVRNSFRRRDGKEVDALFLADVGREDGRRSGGVSAATLLRDGKAMFEDEDPRRWPSFLREEKGEGQSFLDLLTR